ncbi:hypothetical protein ACHAPO_005851 [Fusarium lateritium]
MREQPGAQQQESNDNTQHRNGTESAQPNQNNNNQYQDSYVVPASQLPVEQDFNYRTNITVQSQQRQWPQEMWYHGPTHRVLYRIDLVLHEPGYQNPPPQDTAPTQNTEGNTQQGETNGCSSGGINGCSSA